MEIWRFRIKGESKKDIHYVYDNHYLPEQRNDKEIYCVEHATIDLESLTFTAMKKALTKKKRLFVGWRPLRRNEQSDKFIKPPKIKKSTEKNWMWHCAWHNNASNWKDSEHCTARSRKYNMTQEKAERAAQRHENKTGHDTIVSQIEKRRKRRRKK